MRLSLFIIPCFGESLHIRTQHVQDEHCSTPICESTVQYAVYHYLFFLLSAYQQNMSELISVLYKVNDHFVVR